MSGGIPSTFNALTKLETLALQSNQLSGTVPNLNALAKLKHLRLDANSLAGSLPSCLPSLTNLEDLQLQDNDFVGHIPDLSGLTKLKTLRLADNSLSQGIPATLATLSQLKKLDLHGNDLTGSIPSAFGNRAYDEFKLEGNKLTGCVPSGVWSHEASINPQQEARNLPQCGTSASSTWAMLPVSRPARSSRAGRASFAVAGNGDRVAWFGPLPPRSWLASWRASPSAVLPPFVANPIPAQRLAPHGEIVLLDLPRFFAGDRLGARTYQAQSNAPELARAFVVGDALAIHANARGAQGRLAVFVSTVDGGRHRAPLARVAVEIVDPRARLISRQTRKR